MRHLAFLMFALIAIPLAGFFALFCRPVQRTRAEVADFVERYLRAEVDDDELDAFVCVPIADNRLDLLRQEWSDVSGDPLRERLFLEAALINLRRS